MLCDIFMPRQDGLETIRRLTDEFIGVRIVAMVDKVEGPINYARTALKFGATSTIAKPFTVAELLEAVRSALDDSESRVVSIDLSADSLMYTRQYPEGEELCP